MMYHEDENVVYFLLRNKEDFDVIYKTHFINKVFQKMFAEDSNGAGQLLLTKYSERGFENLLNTIAEKISALGAS